MKICERNGCGKQLPKNAQKRQKYCGNQDDKNSCSYEMLKNRMAEYRKRDRTKICVDCGNQFSSKSWNKTRCGSSRVRGTCAYMYKIKLTIELQKTKRQSKLKIVKEPKIRIVSLETKIIKPEIYITPRLAHLAYIKQHNHNINKKR